MSHYKLLAALVAVTVPVVFTMVNATQIWAQSQVDSTTAIAPL
ncbi:MAG TPA: hypothetical protein VIX14_09545 [Terriglobales bacterium]